jgi:hypothetical protein
MGMFDSFILKVKCPHCGIISDIEFQTKQFRCAMDVWREGEVFDVPGLTMVEGAINSVYGGCTQPKCELWAKLHTPNFIGFGRRIFCDVLIEHGIVVKAINVREED